MSLLLLGFLMQIFSVSTDMKSYDGRTSSCETEAVVRKSVTISPLQSAQVPVATIVQCLSHSGGEGQGVMA